MKMKPMIITGALTLGLFACNNASQNKANNANTETAKSEVVGITPVSYSIDTDKSLVHWKGSMLGVYSHEGTLIFTNGSLSVKGELVIAGDFTVDMNSMVSTDSDELYKMAPREKLIGHLKSDDFFGTEKFPAAEFKIKGADGNIIKGDLTIKGVTHEESITSVKLTETDGSVTVTGSLVFDRQRYDIAYKNTMNDMVLSDDIELDVSITGISD